MKCYNENCPCGFWDDEVFDNCLVDSDTDILCFSLAGSSSKLDNSLNWCACNCKAYIGEPANDLTKCPKCGGPADNGIDRCDPPSAYECTKCAERPDPLSDVEWVSTDLIEFDDAVTVDAIRQLQARLDEVVAYIKKGA